jgi:hypothetical protein
MKERTTNEIVVGMIDKIELLENENNTLHELIAILYAKEGERLKS